jgi:hypothetical protein
VPWGSCVLKAMQRVVAAMHTFLDDAEGPLGKTRRKIFRAVRCVDAVIAIVQTIFRAAPGTHAERDRKTETQR